MSALLQVHWPKLTDEVSDEIDGDRYELGRASTPLRVESGDAEMAICEFEKDVRRPRVVK